MASDSATSISEGNGESDGDLAGAAGLAAACAAGAGLAACAAGAGLGAGGGPARRGGAVVWARGLEGSGTGQQRQPFLGIDPGQGHMAGERWRLALLQGQRAR